MSMRLAVPREPMFTGAILKLITISGFRDSKVRLSILLGIRELILMIILKDFERATTYIYIRGHVDTRGPIDGTAAAAVSTNL